MTTFHEYRQSPDETFDPKAIVTACIESGAGALLIDEDALPPEFFDLSSRVAGELVHGLTLYRITMAAVVADQGSHSPTFQAFVREANEGHRFRFFPDRSSAIAWLETAAV